MKQKPGVYYIYGMTYQKINFFLSMVFSKVSPTLATVVVLVFILGGCNNIGSNPPGPIDSPTALPDLSGIHWIDLTHSFDSSTLYWPNNVNNFKLTTESKGTTEGGYFYSSYSICTPEHGGTHIDAPVHFAENKYTVDQIPLTSLIGPAVKIDISAHALANRDYLISISDIESWENTFGQIPDHTIVLFQTGYGKFYPNRKEYFGTDQKGPDAIPLLHFPGIDPAAAKWLISNRKVKAVGLDTPSLDYGQSKDFLTHRILMAENLPGFENLNQLELLPATGLLVIALPMKIGGGSGGPLRIVAGM
ncbi:MAG: cyclase family protein [Saprospiraceae bacterium]|nr:cyclase family protein [Saprospiraceae bacterium]MBP8095203.1 cyclase family protein [Saprospiraceae bacterium]